MKSCLPQRRSDLEVRDIGDELLVLDRRNGRIHQFNRSAGLVWQCCDGRHSIEEIIDRVTQTYGVPVETVRGDVAAAIEKFSELGLLTTTE